MKELLLVPLLVPFLFAIAALVTSHKKLQRFMLNSCALILFTSTAALFYLAQDQLLVLHLGSWQAPYGINLFVDKTNALFLFLFSFLILLIAPLLNHGAKDCDQVPQYYFLLYGVLFAIQATMLSGDLFNLYVWFELLFVSAFMLMVVSGGIHKIREYLHYLFANLITTFLLLLSVVWIYASAGTLNLAQLSKILPTLGVDLSSWLYLILFSALSLKIGLFPFFYWLPMGYGATSHHVSTFLASLLTKVALLVFLRLKILLFPEVHSQVETFVTTIACLSMFAGVLAAASRMSFREILTTHIVSQLGYIVAAFSLSSPLAVVAGCFYLVKHALAKTSLLLIQSSVALSTGLDDLRSMGSLIKKNRFLCLLFILSAMGLAGLPPLAGFWAKLMILFASFKAQNMIVFTVALVTGFFTAYSMLKILSEVFLKDAVNKDLADVKVQSPVLGSICLLVVLLVSIGCYPTPLIEACQGAVEQLMDVTSFQEAVLGGQS